MLNIHLVYNIYNVYMSRCAILLHMCSIDVSGSSLSLTESGRRRESCGRMKSHVSFQSNRDRYWNETKPSWNATGWPRALSWQQNVRHSIRRCVRGRGSVRVNVSVCESERECECVCDKECV